MVRCHSWLCSANADAIHVAAGGIVFSGNGEILLQKRADNGQWGLPSGYVDTGESVKQAAVREILEETGDSRVSKTAGRNILGPCAQCYRRVSRWQPNPLRDTGLRV